MSFVGWTAAAGALLLVVSLAAGWIKRLPMTPFVVYLAVGVMIGPSGMRLLDVDFFRDSHWLERVTEIALVVSLFIGGLKLRVPWNGRGWQVARRLAFPAMLLGVAATTLIAHYMLSLAWPAALILGATLAPTDPVLAGTVSVDDACDRDSLRVALSGEAGFNDGSAMPFLFLGLALVHQPLSWGLLEHWIGLHVLWGLFAGSVIGLVLGWTVGLVSTWLRVQSREHPPGPLLSLGLIGVTFAVAEWAGALGFVAVFCAGLGMRKVEIRQMQKHVESSRLREDPLQTAPAESLVHQQASHPGKLAQPARAVGRIVADALKFGTVIEMLLAPLLVLLLGISVSRYWSTDGLLLMLPLFFVIRPLATWATTVGLGLDWRRRLLLGWLGLRGIGGLYYLAYALGHGLAGPQGHHVASAAITVITLSVILHGLSAQPLMAWRNRRLRQDDVPDQG